MPYRRVSGFFVAVALFMSTMSTAIALPTPSQQPTHEGQARPPERKGGNPITDGWITMKTHSQFVPENALEDSDLDVDVTNGAVKSVKDSLKVVTR